MISDCEAQSIVRFLEIVIILTLHIKCSTIAMTATVREEYIRLKKDKAKNTLTTKQNL